MSQNEKSLMSIQSLSDRKSMTLRLILALFLVYSFQQVAIASETSNHAGRLLSYAELMRLPQDQRAIYIQGVREILIELSKNPDAKFSDVEAKNRSRLRAWLELVDSQVRSASADQTKTCAQNPQCEVTLRKCLEGKGSFVKWIASKSVYECDPSRPVASLVPFSPQSDLNEIGRRLAQRPDPQFSSSHQIVRPHLGAAQEVPPLKEAIRKEVIQIRPRPDANERFVLPGVKRAPKSLSEYAEEAARGRVRGVKCRSRELPQASSLESKQWESLPVCSDEQEARLRTSFEARQSSITRALLADPGSPAEPPAAVKADPAPAPAIESTEGARAFPVAPPSPDNSRALTESTPRAEYGRKILRSEIQPLLDARENPDKICEKEREALGAGKLVFVPTAKGEAHGYCMTESGFEKFKKGELNPDGERATAEGSPDSRPAANEMPVSQSALNQKFSACAPKPASCESRAVIRKVYYQGNLPCVFAGMVSKLSNGNRRCEAVTTYKVGDKDLKCAAGQTMCNPMLFGTVLGSNPETPICVGRGQSVTEYCGKISNARDAELFLNRNISGIQEKWDEFKRDLESVCKDGTVASKFHCHECNLMRQRLFELHARVVKNPCETGIDEGVRQRIKDRSAPTTQ